MTKTNIQIIADGVDMIVDTSPTTYNQITINQKLTDIDEYPSLHVFLRDAIEVWVYEREQAMKEKGQE